MIKDKIAWLVENFEGGNKTRFARKIGIKDGKSALVHDWINGRSKPKASYQSAICQAYGITVEWLNDNNAPGGSEDLPHPPMPAGKTTAVTGTIDAEKLMELIHSLQQDSRDKAAVIAGLVEST
ncbi:MAG: helix-turn-helix domain-containing protein, partial [Chitinispirillales bacterium]|nr:helix-turn-helix domain-containing protein [Chitinispirillales bacterium]